MKQLKNFLILLLFVVAITLNQCRLLNSNKGNSNKMSSFLQMGQSYIDSKMEKDLEDLEKDESPDLVSDQYKNLNNDANELNEKLQRQLDMDNGAIPTSTADLYVD